MNKEFLNNLYVLAKKSEENQEWDKALKYYLEIYKKSNDPLLLKKMGFLYSQLQKHKEAYLSYKKYLNYVQNDWKTFYNIAVECFQLNQLEESINYLNQSIKIHPDNLKGYLLLGYIYEILNQFQESLKFFTYALNKDPHNKIAIKGIVISLVKLKRYKEAQKICEKYLKIYPDDLVLKNLYAGILFEIGKIDQYVEEIKEISQKDPHYKSFDEYLDKIKEERSIEYQNFFKEIQQKFLQKTMELKEKEDKKTYVDLSILSLFSGNKEDALNYLKKAMELNKKD
jgi:tetratricopeptide (TPR) repeat protein